MAIQTNTLTRIHSNTTMHININGHINSQNPTQQQTSLLRLMQLVSPALPVGAFAYSQGLEYAIHQGWIRNEAETEKWISGILENALCHIDVPVLVRLYSAWEATDTNSVNYWNDFLFSCRESAELQQEDHQLGRSLARLLVDLDVEHARDWQHRQSCTFANLFALAAIHWKISIENTLQGYLWAWLENQVAAAIKLVPLGQTAGQRILLRVSDKIPDTIERGSSLSDDDIGFATPGLAIASALHETQYSRLFRS